MYEDATECIEWGNNIIGGRERTTHIDIRKHFAHEVIQNGELRVVRVPTSSQLAPGHPHEGPTLPAVAGMRRGHPQQEGHFH